MKYNSLKGVHVVATDKAHLEAPDEDGVVQYVPLPAGPIDLTEYSALTRYGQVEVIGCFEKASPKGRVQTQKHPGHNKTAASPDYEPSGERRQQIALAKMIQGIVQKTVEKRDEKALERAEEIRKREQERKEKAEKEANESEKPVKIIDPEHGEQNDPTE